MPTTITRTPWQDDDGTGTTGTIVNNAEKQIIYNQIDEALAGVTTGIETPAVVEITNGGTNVVDLALPPKRAFYYVKVRPTTADITLNIATATGMDQGARLVITNVLGPFTVYVKHYAAAVGDKVPFYNLATSAPTPIATGGAGLFVLDYHYGAWKLVAHEQGAWINRPFDAANFLAVAPITWSPAPADVQRDLYYLKGTILHWELLIGNATLGGAAGGVNIRNPLNFEARSNGLSTPQAYGHVMPGTWQMLNVTTAGTVSSPQTLTYQNIAPGPFYFYVRAAFGVV